MSPMDDRQYRTLYKPSAVAPALVDVPPMRFLMLDGAGGIAGDAFTESVGALFSLAYATKFAAKKQLGLTYKVAPLEGVYWSADESREVTAADRDSLLWQLMIMLPDEVSGEFVDEIRLKVAAKKNPPRLSKVRVQTFSEGMSVQVLHVGPYAAETPTVERLFAFAEEAGYDITGRHHEIYLGDPNRAAQDKLKTVLRYGVRRAK
jgi:hypothetical protein